MRLASRQARLIHVRLAAPIDPALTWPDCPVAMLANRVLTAQHTNWRCVFTVFDDAKVAMIFALFCTTIPYRLLACWILADSQELPLEPY